LSRAGYNVLVAQNVAEAQQLWREREKEIALVITDNSLPDGSGIELVQRLEREKPALKIIVSSGLTRDDLPWRYYQLGKPCNVQFMLAFVKGALERSEPEC
jgi:DNA-binding response OmpR family regulator